MIRRAVGALQCVVLALCVLTSQASAQCADGSAAPCRVAPRPVPIDRNRVAVMPFRVAAADTLLGEGFAELLAPEFTGEGGPRSVDMASTLAAWRRAGGGLRTPLSQDAAMRVSRALGAGVLCQGSIVGVGARLTIAATLLDASSGQTIGNPARASGPLDSMDVLLDRIATELLGAGARAGPIVVGRLTNSPAALRAYFEGMALRRRGNGQAATLAFEASFAADSTFASAAFQRWLGGALAVPSPQWAARTWALRDRLTPDERMMADASFGAGALRSRAQVTADLLRAAQRVESPEAWFLYGDYVYHSGLSVVGPDSVLPIAKRAFEQATALDSTPLSLGHLSSIAYRSGDTALTRRLARFYERLDGEDTWAARWTAASVLNDAAQLARLRQAGPSRRATQFSATGLTDAFDTRATTARIVEGFRLVATVSDATERSRNAPLLWLFHRARGQPLQAENSAVGYAPPHWRAARGGGTWQYVTGDLWDDAAFMQAFGAAPLTPPAVESRRQCLAARLMAQRGRADSVDITTLRRRSGDPCARVIEIWKAFQAGAMTSTELEELDQLVSSSTTPTFMGFEHRLLAGIYEARGDTTHALRAVRHYPRDFTGAWLGPTLREEGRYFLMARDTANAIRSYSHFLDLRTEAEPPYIAERDSIKALVATLTRRR